jgi:hypothetical protein
MSSRITSHIEQVARRTEGIGNERKENKTREHTREKYEKEMEKNHTIEHEKGDKGEQRKQCLFAGWHVVDRCGGHDSLTRICNDA